MMAAKQYPSQSSTSGVMLSKKVTDYLRSNVFVCLTENGTRDTNIAIKFEL